MSSQAGSDLGQNAVICYFPTLPYYVRYQIGFDILINPSDAHADASVAGESQRLIHVELFFPDGFICNLEPSGGMAHPTAFGSGAPHFCPVHSHYRPPLFSHGPHFDRHHPMHFEAPIMSEDLCQARMIANVVNGQPGEFIAIDDTPYDVIRQCSGCRGFHSVQEGEPEYSGQYTSTSGITDQSDTSHATPRKASGHDATDINQRDTSHASPRTASEDVATDRKNHVRKEGTTCSIKTVVGDLKMATAEGPYRTQGEEFSVTVFGNQRTDDLIRHAMDAFDRVRQSFEDDVPKDKEEASADPKVDNDK